MKTIIVGCGRVGSVLADAFDRAGHDVVVLDTKTAAFDRLPGTFRGAAVRGDGTDEDTLRRAGAEGADVFIAMTEGDNRNVMAAQLATEALGAQRVIAKINDPLRASAYAELGIATLCRTNLMAAAVTDFLDMGLSFGPGLSPATGQHPGGEHHADEAANGPAAATSVGATSAATTAPTTATTTSGANGLGGAAPTASPGAMTPETPTTSAPPAPIHAREG